MRSSLACRLAAACLLALALCTATATATEVATEVAASAAGFDLDASVDAQPLTLAQEQAVDIELQALGVRGGTARRGEARRSGCGRPLSRALWNRHQHPAK